MKAASLARALALVALGPHAAGCQDIQSALGGSPPVDAGGAVSSPPLGRSIQGIPIYAGAEVAYAGALETDYQIELRARAATIVDVLRYYDAILRQQGWQLTPPAPDGLAQVVRGTRAGRILTMRIEPAEAGVSIQFLLVSAPPAHAPDTYAPIGDLAPPTPSPTTDGGVADADGGVAEPSPTQALPDGIPLPTGYRLVANRGLGNGSWEVIMEVDAGADAALGRLASEMAQMGWRFGSPGTKAPTSASAPDGTLVGTRAGITVTIRATEAARPAGGLVATVRIVGSPGAR